MISFVSYKDRTKKTSMDSMKSYMILVWNHRNFNPGRPDKKNLLVYVIILRNYREKKVFLEITIQQCDAPVYILNIVRN